MKSNNSKLKAIVEASIPATPEQSSGTDIDGNRLSNCGAYAKQVLTNHLTNNSERGQTWSGCGWS